VKSPSAIAGGSPAAAAADAGGIAARLARPLDLARVDALASAGAASYVTGTSAFDPPRQVDGVVVAGAGGADVFLARYDLATGAPVWARAYGDDLDQFARDVSAPTADGTVAVIGAVEPGGRIGECKAGTSVTCSGAVAVNGSAHEADFLLLVDSTTGAVNPGTRIVDAGADGHLNAVAANPARNLFAVCGQVSATSGLCTGATPESCTPATAYQGGNTDLLVAVFDSAGILQWARQLGGAAGAPSDESCNAVAVAGDGTVWAAGKYQGTLDLGTGPLPALPNLTNVRHMWVAHFGPTGATLAAKAFGVLEPRPTGNVTPYDLEIDRAGNLVVGGSFTVGFPVGGLASAGGTDAFVAKLSPALAGIWGARLGNNGTDATKALAITSGDDVVAVGSYAAAVKGTPTTGMAALAAPPGTAPQVFVVRLDGATGRTRAAGGYGDASVQLAAGVAASGDRAQVVGTYLGTLDFGAPAAPLVNPGVTFLGFTMFADVR
jgi:hypothetical protein